MTYDKELQWRNLFIQVDVNSYLVFGVIIMVLSVNCDNVVD